MSSSDQVYRDLRRLAKVQGKTFQDILIMYGIERSLYRLSQSIHQGQFVLKGGVLLYHMFEGDYDRSTTDIDLLHTKDSNNTIQLMDVFLDIFKTNVEDDGIRYDLSSLKVKTRDDIVTIARIHILALLSTAKIYLTFDVSFHDVVFPRVRTLNMKMLLPNKEFSLHTYSIESLIAEKLHIIVTLGTANTRMKDFFDIHRLISSKNVNSDILEQAINATFIHRNTATIRVDDLSHLVKNNDLRILWNRFLSTHQIGSPISFEQIVSKVIELIPSQWLR